MKVYTVYRRFMLQLGQQITIPVCSFTKEADAVVNQGKLQESLGPLLESYLCDKQGKPSGVRGKGLVGHLGIVGIGYEIGVAEVKDVDIEVAPSKLILLPGGGA